MIVVVVVVVVVVVLVVVVVVVVVVVAVAADAVGLMRRPCDRHTIAYDRPITDVQEFNTY